MDAAALSPLVIQRVILDTLRLIPSIAPQSTFPEDLFSSVASSVTFAPNNTFGSTVARLGPQITDAATSSDVSNAIDSDDVIQSDLYDTCLSLAQTTSNVYGMLRSNISVQADNLVTKIVDKLNTLSARTPDEVAQQDQITFVNWGVLSDPNVVMIATNVCYAEAKAFVPGQEIQPYYIDGCLAAASRFAPPPVQGSEDQAHLARSLEDLASGPETAVTPNTYAATNNSIYLNLLSDIKNKIYAGGPSLINAIDRVTSLYNDVQKYQTALNAPDANAPDSLNTSTAQLAIGIALLMGALQAARQTIYKDTLFFGVDDNGSILVNTDNVSEVESKGYTSANLVTVFKFLSGKAFTLTSRGYTVALALQKMDIAISTESENLADLAERSDIETQQLFQKTITSVVTDWVNSFMVTITPTVSREDIAKQLTLLPIQAVKSDTPLGDLIMNFILFVYNIPALTAMDGFLRTSIGSDRTCSDLDVSTARTLALAQFINWMITQPKYVTA